MIFYRLNIFLFVLFSVQWPKNLKQEPVFINAKMGDKYDVVSHKDKRKKRSIYLINNHSFQLRRYVAELLEKCDSFQFTELRSRIKQENQTQLFPVHEVKKFVRVNSFVSPIPSEFPFFQDHCITRSSRKGVLYCVKGTLVK